MFNNDRRQSEDLDRYITGNYGEDQFSDDDEDDLSPSVLFVAFAGPLPLDAVPTTLAADNIREGIRREIARHTFWATVPVEAKCLPLWTIDDMQDTLNRSILSSEYMCKDLKGVRDMALLKGRLELAKEVEGQIPEIKASLAQGARIYSDLLREMFPAPGESAELNDEDEISHDTMQEYRRLVDYSNSNGEPAALMNAADTIVKLRATLHKALQKIGRK